jgi:uncharacterized Zn finger protein
MNNYQTPSETDKEWWTQQWLDLLNSYRFKKRLERGRNYARQGNVLKIQFTDQKIIAIVQGSVNQPYELFLWLDTFSDEDWQYVINTMSERAIFTAKLLAGEMPRNIEEVFSANGLRLFPFTLDEIHSRCNCPDSARVCKHIAAVYYLLGERFSEDPFVLFELRGRSKDAILQALRQQRGQTTGEMTENPVLEQEIDTQVTWQIENFWQYDQELDPSLVVIAPPPNSETVLDVLGNIPLPADQTGKNSADLVMNYLRQIYRDVSQQAVMTALRQGDE